MSNDRPSSSKRKPKFQIDSVKITDQDTASVRRVLGRLTGRVPFPIDEVEQGQASTIETGSTIGTGSTTGKASTNRIATANEDGTTNQDGNTGESGSTNLVVTTDQGRARDDGSTIQTSTTKQIGTTRKIAFSRQTVAPERDFQRVPNSVTREAMSSGLFRGKSKQVWDYLWSISRGAVVPRRTVRCSRPKIKAGAGLGSMNTVDAAVEHLQVVGLIRTERIVGEEGGNMYEIFTPEEVAARVFGSSSADSTTSAIGNTETTQNMVVPVAPESGSTDTTLSSVESSNSRPSNTFIKTYDKDDDEAFAELLAVLRTKTKEVTGREPSVADRTRWRELGELLTAELAIAAERTSVVSSAPALLVEHLRRRLAPKPTVARQPMAPASTPAPTPPPAPPTDDDLVETYVNFLHSGLSVEQVDSLVSNSIDPEQMPRIRSAAIARFERESTHVSSPSAPVSGD